MEYGVIGEATPSDKCGPYCVLFVGQHAHATVPVAPKDFDDAVTTGIVAHSCRDRGLGDLCQSTHEFRHELGRFITVQDFWGTMLKYNAIQKGGNQSGYFPIRKCDDGDVPRGRVNESKSFAFTGQSFALMLRQV
jgi:hypothetical protein